MPEKNVKTVKVSRSLLYVSGFVTEMETREAVWRIILRFLCEEEPLHFASVVANFSIPFDDLHMSGTDGAIGDLQHNSSRRVTDTTY